MHIGDLQNSYWGIRIVVALRSGGQLGVTVVLLPLLLQDYRINVLTIISVQIINNGGLIDGGIRNDVIDF